MRTTILSVKNLSLFFILCCIILYATNMNSQIRLIKVEPSTNQTTIHNFGTSMVDINGYWFCTKRTYGALTSATIINGSLNLAPGADITLVVNTASGLSTVASDVSIYSTNAFGVATNMVDFMQYGDSFSGTSGRENEAVSQGFWTAGTFILGDPAPWSYTGNGIENGINFWGSTPLSINDEILNAALSIYPNPADEDLKIKKLQNIDLKNASIFDASGRLISSIDLSNTILEKRIALNNIRQGIYYIKITDNQGGLIAKKFIKK